MTGQRRVGRGTSYTPVELYKGTGEGGHQEREDESELILYGITLPLIFSFSPPSLLILVDQGEGTGMTNREGNNDYQLCSL